MTICAYCQEDRLATREHVVPAFIYNFQKELSRSVVGWNEAAQKMVGGEAKIKDVCADCNNRILGELDSYGKTLLTESGLLTQNYTKAQLTLKYDYAALLRWLMKISFNSSRTDNVQSSIFKQHIPFMLGEASPPPRHKVAMLLYLAAAEQVQGSESHDLPFINAAEGGSVLNPFLVRISYGAIPNDRYIHRVIFFGPAVFQLAIFNESVLPGHAAASIRSLIKAQRGAIELTTKRSVVALEAGSVTWLDLYRAQVQRTHAIRDQTVGANNSFKPRPLRGSA